MNNAQRMLEKKAYHEDCGKQTIEELQKRVFLYCENIIYMKELPIVSPFTTNLLFDRIDELGSQFDKWALIIDLREAERPDARSRRTINKRFLELAKKNIYVAYYTKGILLNTAIRFVMFGLNINSYSVNNNFENVLKSAKKSLK